MSKNHPLAEQVTRLLNQLIFMEKKSIFQYGDVTLYPSELHLMIVVLEGGAVNATAMAEKLGVTKGAVSQTISRLVRKKMITKTKDPSNKNELTVHFTRLGDLAMEAFSKTRAKSREAFARYLAGLDQDEKRTIQTFLNEMEGLLAGLK